MLKAVTIQSGGGGSPLLFQVLVSPKINRVGTPYAVTIADSNTYFTNEGASGKVYFSLPTAAADLIYTFMVQDADGLRVVANTGDTIRIAGAVSGSAGYAESTTIGSTVTIVAINATEWVATSTDGTWSVV